MEKMKVLMFGWEYAPIVSGGLGVVCRDLSQSLSHKGIQITFVLPKLPRPITVDYLRLINAAENEVDEELIKHIEVNAMLTPYIDMKGFDEMNAWKRRKLSDFDTEIYGLNLFDEVIRYAAKAYQIARDTKHDIIHAHDWMTFKAAINAKKVSRKPLVVHIHATEVERTAGSPNPLIFQYEQEGMQQADKVIAVSDKTRQIIINYYGINPGKVEVVHNAVAKELSETKQTVLPKRPYKTVLFLARMAASKGADYLLKAAAKVLTKYQDVKFVFVGKGSMLEDLIDLSIDLGISKNVIFAGFLNHEEVDLAYKTADLFVMPSVTEPFGITALEAIRNGTPVLMSKQSGASEVVKNCLKVDFWDVDEMANKILAVLLHGPLAEQLVNNGYHDLQQMDWDTQGQKVIEVYNHLLH